NLSAGGLARSVRFVAAPSFSTRLTRSSNDTRGNSPAAFRVYRYVSLPLSPAHHGTCVVDRGSEDGGTAYGRRGVGSGRAVLGKDFRNQLHFRGGHRHSAGI